MNHRTPIRELPYAGIICKVHGNVDIGRNEYMYQMGQPNSRWKCPKCGSHAEFDDQRYEALHPEEE